MRLVRLQFLFLRGKFAFASIGLSHLAFPSIRQRRGVDHAVAIGARFTVGRILLKSLPQFN